MALSLLPYPIYYVRTNSNAHVRMFWKIIQINGEKRDTNIMHLFCFTLKDVILECGENFMQFHLGYIFLELEATFYKHYSLFKTMNKFTWLLESLSRATMKGLRFTMNGSSNLPIVFNIRWTTYWQPFSKLGWSPTCKLQLQEWINTYSNTKNLWSLVKRLWKM